MGDVRTRLTDVAAHLAHDTNMIVAIEEVVFVLPTARPTSRAMRRLVGLKCGIAKDDNQTLRVLVVGGDWLVLFSYKSRQLGWRHRLGSCRWGSRVSMRHVGWAESKLGANILARFVPRSGESREVTLSWEDSA